MKKTLIIAFAAIVALTAFAGKKGKKAAEVKNTPAPVVLTTGSDSVSFAAGYQQVRGLTEFLLQQNMDTAYMADFIIGLREAIDKSEDPAFKAHQMGFNIAQQLKTGFIPALQGEMTGTPDTLVAEHFYNGFLASLEKDTTHFKTEQEASEFFQQRLTANQAVKAEASRKANVAFLEENAKKEGVITTESGLQYKILVQGNGQVPQSNQEVSVKYEGKLIDGKIFDSSYRRKDPITKFRCDQVIKGWTEALTMMPVGSTWELYIPQELAYGDRGAGNDIPPYSTLIFKVELIGVE